MRPSDELLTDTLREAQRVGALGDRRITEVIEHARAFTRALDGVHGTVVDLGSGGGVPGLVVALDRPDLALVLVDRRQKRTDLLARAVHRLGVEGRVHVLTVDARRLAETAPGSFDAALARGFGPPEATLRLAAALVRQGGAIVISEPPGGDRWDSTLVRELGLRHRRLGAVTRFDVE